MFDDGSLGISIDQTTRLQDIADILSVFAGKNKKEIPTIDRLLAVNNPGLPETFSRSTSYLSHPVFNSYHSETELLRYVNRLQSRDLSLTTSMIPLGSCTMKLNATVEMIPVTWPSFSEIHPFAPEQQTRGYAQMTDELEDMLAEITGLPGVSLQPNAGSQGEYAGLMVIRKYHHERGDEQRTVCLIPQSAHGTNPASAVLAGMKVVPVACDEDGNIDIDDLRRKAEEHSDDLAAIMVTYPSTHGVFEEGIREICRITHASGGLVYMDGANMNAQGWPLPSRRLRRGCLPPQSTQDVLYPARGAEDPAWGRSPQVISFARIFPNIATPLSAVRKAAVQSRQLLGARQAFCPSHGCTSA